MKFRYGRSGSAHYNVHGINGGGRILSSLAKVGVLWGAGDCFYSVTTFVINGGFEPSSTKIFEEVARGNVMSASTAAIVLRSENRLKAVELLLDHSLPSLPGSHVVPVDSRGVGTRVLAAALQKQTVIASLPPMRPLYPQVRDVLSIFNDPSVKVKKKSL